MLMSKMTRRTRKAADLVDPHEANTIVVTDTPVALVIPVVLVDPLVDEEVAQIQIAFAHSLQDLKVLARGGRSVEA
ncbi:hypothetical protein QYF36_024007 [Acer negundo]|nr:hypothetical protein QYF36_024007 [Acer negundo]